MTTPTASTLRELVLFRAKPRPRAPEKNDFTEFLREARERFRLASQAENLIRSEALDDLKFYSGEQWPEQIIRERTDASRPYLTFNRLPQFARQVLNDQRQARPSIEINPVGDEADVETAQVIQGLTRHIEISSDAEIAYDTAFAQAVIHGFGYFRLTTEYVDERSFDQEIRIKRILDPFTVYYDPGAREPDYSDAKFCFIVQDLSREEYKAQFKDSQVAGLSDFASIGDTEREWFAGGNIRIAEYFWVETKTRKLVALLDGRSAFEDELTADAQVMLDPETMRPITRETETRHVRWAKINAREILDRGEWPGPWIPIIPVLGEEMIVDGKRKLVGIVRYAKDAQRDYNYERTALVETIALAPKAPWMVAKGQDEGFEEEYRQANVRNLAVLHYNPDTLDGNLLPAPHRNAVEAPIRDLTVAVAQADNDLKATTGIYDASLGAPGPEQSGKAIIARQKEGDVANLHLIDNLSRSIRFGGRQIVAAAPKVYDRPGRVVRIVKPDQTKKAVKLYEPFEEEQGSGVLKFYDLNVGKYDVTVSVGPGEESKRKEFVQSVLDLVQSVPQIGQFILDLVVRHMDWPGANEIADRLQKMLPAQLQEAPKAGPQQEIPPEVQQKLEMLLAQHAALTQQLDRATSIIESRRMELESRERIAGLQEQTKVVLTEAKLASAEGIEILRQQLATINKRLDLLHQAKTVEQEMPGKESGARSQESGETPR